MEPIRPRIEVGGTLRIPTLTALAALLLLALGCATPESVQRRSSLTAYLGGKEAVPVIPKGPTKLQLPLRLGVAFVPNESSKRAGNNLAWGCLLYTSDAADE